jgi:predicted RNA-binding protein with PIN domain
VSRLVNRPLEEARQGLLLWLTAARPQGSARNKVTVVFDGKSEHLSFPPASGEIRVVFTCQESADDYIKRLVEESGDPKKFVVISDDKDIKLYVRALGAGVLSVREFAADLFQRKAGGVKAKPSAGSTKYITVTQANKINSELERVWGIKKS